MHRNLILSILLVMFVLMAGPALALIDEGDDAPDFRYEDLDGNELWFHEEYEGRIVVLEFMGVG